MTKGHFTRRTRTKAKWKGFAAKVNSELGDGADQQEAWLAWRRTG